MTTKLAPTVSAIDADIPAIGLGTWPMTGAECVSAVANAIAHGYRHIDTAAMYDNEIEVGEGVRRSGIPREEIFITTKVWSSDIGDGDLQRSAQASLAKLKVSQVDLLLIHWPNAAVPVRESIGALCDAKAKGYARHIGISNFPSKLMDEAIAASSEPFVCNQVEYHPLLDQQKVHANCRQHGMAMVSYSPLGRGGQDGLLNSEEVRTLAQRHGKTPGQIVLRWHVQQPGVVAIPKSAQPARQAENIDIFDFELEACDMSLLSALANPTGRIVDPTIAPQWD